jgi:hypothetical protein
MYSITVTIPEGSDFSQTIITLKTPDGEELPISLDGVLPNNGGYIYFLQASNGLVKIGKAYDLGNRMHSIRTISPLQIKLIHFVKTANRHTTELFFHKIFESKRKNGEWFELDENDLDKVYQYTYWTAPQESSKPVKVISKTEEIDLQVVDSRIVKKVPHKSNVYITGTRIMACDVVGFLFSLDDGKSPVTDKWIGETLPSGKVIKSWEYIARIINLLVMSGIWVERTRQRTGRLVGHPLDVIHQLGLDSIANQMDLQRMTDYKNGLRNETAYKPYDDTDDNVVDTFIMDSAEDSVPITNEIMMIDERIINNILTNYDSISISLIQRRFGVGYTKALRIVSIMENRGMLSDYVGGNKKRNIVKNNTNALQESN